MAEADERPEPAPLTEPVIVAAVFITGLKVEVTDDYVRIVAWEQLPKANGDMPERRIVGRWVMPKATGRDLDGQLRKGLSIQHDRRDN